MLTADLVHVHRRGDRLMVVPLAPALRPRALALAGTALALVRAHVGLPRGALLEAWNQVAIAPSELRLARGLFKLALDTCEFEEGDTVEPVELRRELFARAAAERLAGRGFDRQAVLAEVARVRGLESDALEEALYADLPSAHVLRQANLPTPAGLLDLHEMASHQAVLLRAVRVQARVFGADVLAYRTLFRKLKFHRLLCKIAQDPGTLKGFPDPPAMVRAGRSPAAPHAQDPGTLKGFPDPPAMVRAGRSPAAPHAKVDHEGGYTIDIDGPMSLFEQTTKYGLNLALVLPAIMACDNWEVHANIRWGKDRRDLRYHLRGSRGAGGPDLGSALPDEVAALLADLRQMATPWVAAPADVILSLPGVGVCVPDVELVHRQSGRRVFLEVLGFWSREAVWKRIELSQAGLPVPIVFAISKHLRVSEEALPADLPAALYVYARTMNGRAVLERVAAVAARATG